MTVNDLAAALGMKIIQPSGGENDAVTGYTSDLLSDVMANAKEGCALITIQAHVNTVAVAGLTGAACIIICNNTTVPNDMIQAAEREEIPILQSDRNQFITSHQVYQQINEKK